MPIRPSLNAHTRGLRRTDAGAALSLLLLPGCVSAGIDRADRAAETRIAQAERAVADRVDDLEAKTRAALAEALSDAQERADDSVARATADLAARVSAERAATLADVDERIANRLADAEERTTRLLAPVLAELRLSREAAQQESAAWRERVDRALAQVEALRTAISPPAPAEEHRDGLPPEDRYALWAALAGAVFTVGKTGVRLWRSRHPAGAA